MSETVHYKGKLSRIIKTDNKNVFESICEVILNKHEQLELEDYYDSWSDQIRGELYNEYVVIEKDGDYSLYEVVSRKSIDEYEMFNITELMDEEYEYEVMYYNGGMGLSEAIEEALNRTEA